MDHLQTDIDSLETERGQLKEKLKSIGKKPLMSLPVGDNVTGSVTAGSGIQSLDNKFLMQEINSLREALLSETQQKERN